MSFCPECGKAVGPNAAKCASCGFALPEAEKPGGGARFKGTMMMAAPAVGLKAAEPANANAKPEAPAVAAAGGGGAAPMRAGGGPAAAPMAKAASPAKPHVAAAKMTMMGAGIAPPVAKSGSAAAWPAKKEPAAAPPAAKKGATPAAGVAAPVKPAETPSVRAVANVAVTPPPEAPRSAPPQFAATQAMPGPPPAPPQRAEPATGPKLNPRSEPDAANAHKVDQASLDEARRIDRERSAAAHVATQAVEPAVADAARKGGRYLPGDPMAPGAGAHPAKQSTPRLALQHEDTYVVPKGEKKWMYWAIGGVVLVSVVLLAIGLF